MLKQRSPSASWEDIKQPKRLKHRIVLIYVQLKQTHLYLACKICNFIPQAITKYNESVILLYFIQCQSRWTSFNDPVYLFLPIIQEENSQPASQQVRWHPCFLQAGNLATNWYFYLQIVFIFGSLCPISCCFHKELHKRDKKQNKWEKDHRSLRKWLSQDVWPPLLKKNHHTNKCSHYFSQNILKLVKVTCISQQCI